MGHWRIAGIDLQIPDHHLDTTLRRVLDKGWYEGEERRALEAHLRHGDSVLDLGGGTGFLAACAARVIGADRVVTVEANPDMLPVIRTTLAANGAGGVRLRHGAVTAGSAAGAHRLTLGGAFWMASTAAETGARQVDVPGLSLSALLSEHDPSVLVVDVEGAEADFFVDPLPAATRLIVVELHPQMYSRRSVAALFARLAAQDFAYQPVGSTGRVVCFDRLGDDA